MAPVPEISEGSFEPARDCFGSGKILAHAHAAQVTMKREHRCERRLLPVVLRASALAHAGFAANVQTTVSLVRTLSRGCQSVFHASEFYLEGWRWARRFNCDDWTLCLAH